MAKVKIVADHRIGKYLKEGSEASFITGFMALLLFYVASYTWATQHKLT